MTDNGIAGAIIDRHRAGLDVAGVIEGGATGDPGSDYGAFVDAALSSPGMESLMLFGGHHRGWGGGGHRLVQFQCECRQRQRRERCSSSTMQALHTDL